MIKREGRAAVTLESLNQALDRLCNGTPLRTKSDGKISLSRINSEANLSSGAIYYYSDFVEYAKKIIKEHKKISLVNTDEQTIKIKKLRDERDNEKKLKNKYRDQRDKIKDFSDQIIGNNARLEFALYEAQNKIAALEEELEVYKNKLNAG